MKIQLHKNIISLERVDESNLEQLRLLRNNAVIQSLLANSGHINQDNQISWFNAIDHSCNFYFLISIEQKLKGYCLLKNIDMLSKSGEPGIFIIDEDFWGTTLGALLTIAFLDFCADHFSIDFFWGNVLPINRRAIKNYSLFNTFYYQENTDKELFLKSAKPYRNMEKINKIRKYLLKFENYERDFHKVYI